MAILKNKYNFRQENIIDKKLYRNRMLKFKYFLGIC